MDLDNLYLIKSLLIDIKNKKFKVINKFARITYSDKIKKDFRYNLTKKWFIEKYQYDGRGIKSMIKDFDLPISYSMFRTFLIFMKIDLHKANVSNDFLKRRRKINALYQSDKKIGMFSEITKNNLKIKNSIIRGIQGYYWNSYKQKYVWLRSSWEFIYAKWLNKNNINWDIEKQTYNILYDNKNVIYRPDFFIYDNENKLIQIVEIKGYWKDKLYKTNILNEMLSIDVICVDYINPYLEQSLKKEVNLWKTLRKLELNK